MLGSRNEKYNFVAKDLHGKRPGRNGGFLRENKDMSVRTANDARVICKADSDGIRRVGMKDTSSLHSFVEEVRTSVLRDELRREEMESVSHWQLPHFFPIYIYI